jgi:hypothetical protein
MPSETRRYSYIDVLEHVSDGVHVDIVNRRNPRNEIHRVDDKPRPPPPSDGTSHRRGRRRTRR